MYVRLAFAVAVHSDPDILLVDEVLAVGDEPFQRKCIDKIRDFQEEGRSIILVSHSAEQIVDVCDRAVVLDRGAIIATGKAPDAMSMLHQWYQQQLLDASEAAKAAPGGAPPPRPCTIDGVELLDGLTDHPDGFKIFEPGSSLTVGIDLQAPDRLDEYAVLLNVETDRGQHVLGVDSRKLDLELPSFRGSARILVTLPRLYLGEGDFSFNAVVLNEDGFEIDNLRHAAFMAVRSDGTTVGFVKAFPRGAAGGGGPAPAFHGRRAVRPGPLACGGRGAIGCPPSRLVRQPQKGSACAFSSPAVPASSAPISSTPPSSRCPTPASSSSTSSPTPATPNPSRAWTASNWWWATSRTPTQSTRSSQTPTSWSTSQPSPTTTTR